MVPSLIWAMRRLYAPGTLKSAEVLKPASPLVNVIVWLATTVFAQAVHALLDAMQEPPAWLSSKSLTVTVLLPLDAYAVFTPCDTPPTGGASAATLSLKFTPATFV